MAVSAIPIVTFVFFGGQVQRNYALRSDGHRTRGRVTAVQRIIGGEPVSFTVAFEADGRPTVATDERSQFPAALREVQVGDSVALTYLSSQPAVVLVGELVPLPGRADTASDMMWPVIIATSCGIVLWLTRWRLGQRISNASNDAPLSNDR
jgi:hypothetical protein